MLKMAIKIIVSAFFLGLIFVHYRYPDLNVDAVSIVLLVLALSPWLLKYLKSLEIPGVISITLADAKAATDKLSFVTGSGVLRAQSPSVIGKGEVIDPKTGEVKLAGHPPTVSLTAAKKSTFERLRDVYGSDPNLALVGFRIEIEKRVRALAKKKGLSPQWPLSKKISVLSDDGTIPSDAASGLKELVSYGNSAAHGARVDPEAGEWVLDAGEEILSRLDSLIVETDSDA